MTGNYEAYMSTNLEKYLGEWIAVAEGKIVAHGENPKEVYWEFKKKYPDKIPFLACVPKSTALIL